MGLSVLLWLITRISPSTFWAAVSALSAFATLVVLLVAAVIALSQIKETVRSRNAALFSELSRRWDEDQIVESRHLANSYAPERLARRLQWLEDEGDFDEQQILYRMPNFLEDLAVLEADGHIPFDMIRRSLGGTLVAQWQHWELAVAYLRGDQHYDLVYENWEDLARRMGAEMALRQRASPRVPAA